MMPAAPTLLSPPDSTASAQWRGGALFVHDGGAAAKPAPPTAPSRAMSRTAARDALYTRDRSRPWRRRRPGHGWPRSGDGSIAVAKGLLWAGAAAVECRPSFTHAKALPRVLVCSRLAYTRIHRSRGAGRYVPFLRTARPSPPLGERHAQSDAEGLDPASGIHQSDSGLCGSMILETIDPLQWQLEFDRELEAARNRRDLAHLLAEVAGMPCEPSVAAMDFTDSGTPIPLGGSATGVPQTAR